MIDCKEKRREEGERQMMTRKGDGTKREGGRWMLVTL